jgi:hypothetical protein
LSVISCQYLQLITDNSSPRLQSHKTHDEPSSLCRPEERAILTDYTDFQIDVQPLEGEGYPLVVRGAGGEAQGLLRLPTGDTAYQQLSRRLAALDTDEDALAQLGQMLFDALFQGQVKQVYLRSQAKLGEGQGLRVKLCIAPTEAEVAALPWEFLHDQERRPLALRNTSIVRYLPQPRRIVTLKTELPLKILLTSARTPPITDVERELQVIEESLSRLGELAQITVEPHLTRDKLQALLHRDFDVWHFVGHGGFGRDGKTGQLLFEDATGDIESISAPELEDMLAGSGVHLIVLDACESARLAIDPFRSLAPALIRAEVPTVIAMQLPVPEEATREFAKQFYLTLAEGLPIDSCLAEGRKGMRGVAGLRRADWGIPVLYTRAPDIRLFDLPQIPVPNVPGAIKQLAHDGRPGAALQVHDRAGTLLSTPSPELPRRLDRVPRPPRAPLGFLDREQPQRDLLPALRPYGGAWLHGPPGCGLSALLRQMAGAQPTDTLPDGVAYVEGEIEPASLEEIVQRLFNRFYSCDTPLKVSADQTYLSDLKALFILDRLPLNRADLKHLATDILCDGAVLVAADSSAPDALPDMALSSLPSAEALALLTRESGIAAAPDSTASLEQLCELLDYLPLPLLLAARLVRTQTVTPQRLVDMLQEAIQRAAGQPAQAPRPSAARQDTTDNALARSVRLSLIGLSEQEQAVLAALVRAGGPDARVDALVSISELPLPTIENALAWLSELGLVVGENERYAIPFTSLRRALDRLLRPGEERQRAAAFFATAALAHAHNLSWLAAERANLLAALQTLVAQGQMAQAGALAQALQPLLALRGLWSSWRQVADWAMQAAQATGDQQLEGWALHERGTHAGLNGDYAAAAADLEAARQLRLRQGDRAGAAASQHNMAYLGLLPPLPPARPWWRRLRRPLIVAAVFAILLLGSGIATTLALIDNAPSAVNDSASTVEEQAVSVAVLANDKAKRGNLDPGSLQITTGPAHGVASVDATAGQITYKPDKDFFGDDRLTYQVCDSHSACASATLDVTVAPVDDPPEAEDQTTTTPEDTPIVIDLLKTDRDADGQLVTLASVSPKSDQGGSVSSSGGSATYTPPANFFGTDRFTYTLADSGGSSATGTVTVIVKSVNDPPIAAEDRATTNEDSPIAIDVLANDEDVDDKLDPAMVQVIAAPANGTVTGDQRTGKITYSPKANFFGVDSFIYQICDPNGACASARVSVTIAAVNDPPTAANDSVSTPEDTPAAIDVLAKAHDIDSPLGPASVLLVGAPAHGKAAVNRGDGQIGYRPDQNYSGPDQLTYQICDEGGLCASATIALTVTPVNDPPVAQDDDATTTAGRSVAIPVLGNDRDVDDDINNASVRVAEAPAHGKAVFVPRTRQIIYTPGLAGSSPNDAYFVGTDTFTYQICDSGTPVLCATATVTVKVSPIIVGLDHARQAYATSITIDVYRAVFLN